MLCLLHIKSNKVDILYEIKMKPSAKVDKSLVLRLYRPDVRLFVN